MRRLLYAVLLYGYLADNGAAWLSFRGCLQCYDGRQGKYDTQSQDTA